VRVEPSTVSYVRIRDGRMDRTVPVDAALGTIEIDLSGNEARVVLPADASVTVERG
jgi:hypothetical protein